MRALVSGATGMLGRSLVRRLLAGGVAVRAMVRPAAEAAGLASSGAEVARVDVKDPAAIGRAVEGCQVVFHALGQVRLRSVFSRSGDSGDMTEVNVDVTERLLEASLRAGVARFLYVSSTAVYGLDAAVPVAESVAPSVKPKAKRNRSRPSVNGR